MREALAVSLSDLKTGETGQRLHVRQEPNLQPPLFNRKPNPTGRVKERGDLRFTVGSVDVIGDVIIKHPNTITTPDAAAEPAVTAEAAFKAKTTEYDKGLTYDKRSFTPIALETGGRWHHASRRLITKVIARTVTNEDDRKKWTPNDHKMYNFRVRTVFQTTSVALRSIIALSLRRLAEAAASAVAAGSLREPPGPAGGAGAAAAAGPEGVEGSEGEE